MSSLTAAKRYAKGLLQLGIEKSITDKILADMQFIKTVSKGTPMLLKVLNSPVINEEKKKSILQDILKGNVSDTTLRLVDILADKNRFGLLIAVAEAFEKLYNVHAGILEITIKTAFELESDQLKKIIDALTTSTGKTIKHTVIVDKKLIGGVAIQYGDTVIDGSVRNKLEQLTGLLQVSAA